MSKTDAKTMQDVQHSVVTVRGGGRQAPEEATLYKVLARSYINGSIAEPGTLVRYVGRPGSNLEYVSGPKWEPQAGVAASSSDKPKAV